MMRLRSELPTESLDLQAAQAWLEQGNSTHSPVLELEDAIEEKRFLRFSLGKAQGKSPSEGPSILETALLPLDSIQEVSQIPQRGVLPVPEVADAILGIANCRGTILWLVDLIQFLGKSSSEEVSTSSETRDTFSPAAIPSFNTLTIQAAGQSIGLVVPQVMDIEIHDASTLHPPTTDLFPNYLLPFLAGHLGRSPVLSASSLIENLQMQR